MALAKAWLAGAEGTMAPIEQAKLTGRQEPACRRAGGQAGRQERRQAGGAASGRTAGGQAGQKGETAGMGGPPRPLRLLHDSVSEAPASHGLVLYSGERGGFKRGT